MMCAVKKKKKNFPSKSLVLSNKAVLFLDFDLLFF